MVHVRLLLYSITVLFLISGCASDWEKATQKNTLEAYQEFINKHPDSRYAYKCKKIIEELEREARIRSLVPSDTPEGVIYYSARLSSYGAVERAYAAYRLGEIGREAAAAVPFLREILNDNRRLKWREVNAPHDLFGFGRPTSPGEEAAKAIRKIKIAIKEWGPD